MSIMMECVKCNWVKELMECREFCHVGKTTDRGNLYCDFCETVITPVRNQEITVKKENVFEVRKPN